MLMDTWFADNRTESGRFLLRSHGDSAIVRIATQKNKMKTIEINKLETEINAWLAATPAERRPETSHRTRIQSVAYSARGAFEATDGDGNVECVTVEVAQGWMQ